MKRYLIFAGDAYYPCGGMHDFIHDVDTIEEVIEILDRVECDWSQVYDSEKRWEIDLKRVLEGNHV